MFTRQHKNTKYEEAGRRLRRRFYKGAAAATLVYVSLSLVSFHGGYSQLPHALAITWAVFLLCYTTFKEVIRWSDSGEEEVYHGEFWAALVIAGMAWMIGWNIVKEWVFHAEALHLPEDYQAATIETIVLYTLSTISSLLYKHNLETEPEAENEENRVPRKNSTSRAVLNNKNGQVVVRPAKNEDIEIVLVKNRRIKRTGASPKKTAGDKTA